MILLAGFLTSICQHLSVCSKYSFPNSSFKANASPDQPLQVIDRSLRRRHTPSVSQVHVVDESNVSQQPFTILHRVNLWTSLTEAF